jgi:NAD+ kinase
MTVAQQQTGTIAIYVDLTRDHARRAAALAAQTLSAAGFAIAVCDEQDEQLHLATAGALIEDAFVLLTIGGDGTLLRAGQIAVPAGLPLFGVNTGRLGFLTELDATAASIVQLPQILRAGFTIDERAVLRGEVNGRTYIALNDIVMKRAGTAHMTPFSLFVDGKEAARVPADGIVVSTPTGSTGYSLSAGGPILEPTVAAFGIVALAAHTLFARPLVVAETSTIEIICDGDSTAHATLEADGRVIEELHAGDRVTIVRNDRRVRFARRAPLNFFALLEDKLRWNAPIKDGSQRDDET